MTMFAVIENTPGYMPDTEPERFDTFHEARGYANELIEQLVDSGYHFDSDYFDMTPSGNGRYYIAYFSDPEKVHDLGRVVEVFGVEES